MFYVLDSGEPIAPRHNLVTFSVIFTQSACGVLLMCNPAEFGQMVGCVLLVLAWITLLTRIMYAMYVERNPNYVYLPD